MNIFKPMEGIFNIYCQSKDMADFLSLQGKLEPPDLNLLSKSLSVCSRSC